MSNSTLLLTSIILLFMMLWLPFGQYDFLVEHWMKIGAYAVPFLLMGAFAMDKTAMPKGNLQDFRFIAILSLIAYIIHQYEEHWIDLFGNYYAFYEFNNNFILNALGEPTSEVRPLTKESIFMINTTLVWLLGSLAIWSSPKRIFPLITMASIVVVNGVVHLLAGMVNWTYNPGIVTSAVIFVPIYIIFARSLLQSSKSYRQPLIAGLVLAFVGHVVMVLGLLLANWYHVFPEYVYFVALVIFSVSPLLFYRKISMPRPSSSAY